MQVLVGGLAALDRVLCLVAACTVIAIVAVGGSGVAMRYVFGQPIAWTDKFMEYAVPLVVMLCAAFLLSRDDHIRVDVIERLGSPLLRRFCIVVGDLLMFLVAVLLAWSGASMVRASRHLGLYDSGDLGWPLWLLQLCVPLGAGLMVVAAGSNVLKSLGARRQPGGR